MLRRSELDQKGPYDIVLKDGDERRGEWRLEYDAFLCGDGIVPYDLVEDARLVDVSLSREQFERLLDMEEEMRRDAFVRGEEETRRDGHGADEGRTKDTNPKDRAATTRLDLSLFPTTALIYGALALVEGDLKYGGHNYRIAGVRGSVYVSALTRHLLKYVDGEWADPKTRVPHLASIVACAAILIDGHEKGNINDDRPPLGTAADLLERCEEIVAHMQRLFPNPPGRYTRDDERDECPPAIYPMDERNPPPVDEPFIGHHATGGWLHLNGDEDCTPEHWRSLGYTHWSHIPEPS